MTEDQIKEIIKTRPGVDIDLSYRCPLLCPNCARQHHPQDIKGKDLEIENFKKVLDYFEYILFSGAYSDPVHHPKFIEILKLAYESKKEKQTLTIEHASGFKTRDWYVEAFKANPNAIWTFGIDGPPHLSHQYRINQDGEKLFEVMLESRKYLKNPPIWQYIVFNYNEDHVEYCKDWAHDEGLVFKKILSGKHGQERSGPREGDRFDPIKAENKAFRNKDTSKIDRFNLDPKTTIEHTIKRIVLPGDRPELDPKCLKTDSSQQIYQLTNKGYILPCSQLGIPQGYNDLVIHELRKYSNISDYDSFEELFAQPQWIEYYKNLLNKVGPARCFFICAKSNEFSNHSIFEYSDKNGHIRTKK